MSEVAELYSIIRWAMSLVLIVFVLGNVAAVGYQDIQLIVDPEDAVRQNGGTVEDVVHVFYITNSLPKLAGYEINCLPYLGALELIGLSAYLASVCKHTFDIIAWDGFRRWYGVQILFLDIMPALSTYSAIKLLNYFIPQVAANMWKELGFELLEAWKGKIAFPIVISRIVVQGMICVFAGIVGFDTFLLRLRITAECAALPGWLESMLPCVQFLVQILGIVQLAPFMRHRLFEFVFGGEDGLLNKDEAALRDVWQSLLVKRMYNAIPFSQFLCVMTSFGDQDFQKLVLNENAAAKQDELHERHQVPRRASNL